MLPPQRPIQLRMGPISPMGPCMRPPSLSLTPRSFRTDERQTGLASHPKYTIASICLTFVLEAEDWLNHMKIKAYFSQVVEPLNRKIYCPPARARPHCRDGGTFFPPSSWVPVSRPTATGSLGRVKKAPMHSFHLSQGCHMLQDIRRNGN